jgi:hypothetical protein
VTKRANDEGSVWLPKDGRWCAAYFVPVAGAGRRRKYVYGKTRKEAHDRLVEMIQQVNRGIPVPVTSQGVDDYLEAWLTGVSAQPRRPQDVRGLRGEHPTPHHASGRAQEAGSAHGSAGPDHVG